MALSIKPANDEQALSLDRALTDLRRVRDLLKHAGATKSAAKVRSAIKSAEGARRHMSHRLARSKES